VALERVEQGLLEGEHEHRRLARAEALDGTRARDLAEHVAQAGERRRVGIGSAGGERLAKLAQEERALGLQLAFADAAGLQRAIGPQALHPVGEDLGFVRFEQGRGDLLRGSGHGRPGREKPGDCDSPA